MYLNLPSGTNEVTNFIHVHLEFIVRLSYYEKNLVPKIEKNIIKMVSHG